MIWYITTLMLLILIFVGYTNVLFRTILDVTMSITQIKTFIQKFLIMLNYFFGSVLFLLCGAICII